MAGGFAGVIAVYADPARFSDFVAPHAERMRGFLAVLQRPDGSFHAEFADAVRLIGQRAIDVRPIISHSLPLDRATEAFDLASDRKLACKVQLSFAE